MNHLLIHFVRTFLHNIYIDVKHYLLIIESLLNRFTLIFFKFYDVVDFESFGMLAYIGGYKALSNFTGGARLKGWISWFVWRSAYLSQQGSWRLRMQVPMDWTKTFLFGRDLSRF